jgi:hypothetical protein
MDFFVRLGILINWKGTKETGNSRKNSVKNPPIDGCQKSGSWGWQKICEKNITWPVSSVPRWRIFLDGR